MKIGIDIDNTLTDIKKELDNAAIDYARSIDKLFDENKIRIEYIHNNSYSYQKLFNFNYDELKYFLKYIQEPITNNALPRDNVVEIINKLKRLGHLITIITARTDEFHDNPYEQSIKWLEKNNIYYDKLVVNSRDKGLSCIYENIDLYIDDNLNNCIKINDLGIQAIRICDNKDKNKNIISFNNWANIYNYIKKEKIVKIVQYKYELKNEVNLFINKSMHDFIGREYKERPDILDIDSYYLNNNGNFWCAIDVGTGEIVGTIALENRINIGILKRLYVNIGYQNLNIGSRLYNILEQYTLNRTSIKIIYLACGKVLKKAHKFYFKKGFFQIDLLDIKMHVADDDYFFKKELLLSQN